MVQQKKTFQMRLIQSLMASNQKKIFMKDHTTKKKEK